jgi:hypothetical protein
MSDEEWIPSKYCKAYQEMKLSKIDNISEHCKFIHDKWPMYQRTFFTNNPTASESDWTVWESYYQRGNWEDDIWFMGGVEFKYSWPYHAAFIEEFMLYYIHNPQQDITE